MKTVFVIAGLIFFGFGCSTDKGVDLPKTDKINVVESDIASGRIRKIIFYSIPYDAEFVVSVTPDVLEKLCLSPITKDCSDPLRQELIYALHNTKVESTAVTPDLRWGAHLCDTNDISIHKIYLDRWGKDAIIDGQAMSINRYLIRWFERNGKR